VKIGRDVLADRQTHRHGHHNTSPHHRERSNNRGTRSVLYDQTRLDDTARSIEALKGLYVGRPRTNETEPLTGSRGRLSQLRNHVELAYTTVYEYHCHRRRSRGGRGGTAPPPMTGLGGTMHSAPQTPVDRNKAYCFHELVLNLPAPLDIQ